MFPVWHGFRGGKGVATLVGAYAGLDLLLLVPLFASWFGVVIVSGFVGLASIAASIAMPVYLLIRDGARLTPALGFALACALLVIYTHRGNVRRMRAGTEPRARRLWLARARAFVSGAPQPLPQRVFQRLGDRDFQSGEALASDLGVTRAAIWKAVEQLRELGVALDAQTNKGYRLAAGVSALSAERIAAQLPHEVRARIEALEVHWTLESTNTRLLDSLPPAAGGAAIVLAEHQTGGRGRRGRGWVAPPGGAICLSLSWQYADMPADLSALSLIVGLCAVNALHEIGVGAAQVKWPNDLVTPNGKLGGILIEMRAEAGGPVHVVVGVGLNVRLDDAARASSAGDRQHRGRHPRAPRVRAGSQPDRRGAARAPGPGAGRISATGAGPAPGQLERMRRAA